MKSEYGGLEISEAKRLRTFEAENAKLKRLLTGAMLDDATLKDSVRSNGITIRGGAHPVRASPRRVQRRDASPANVGHGVSHGAQAATAANAAIYAASGVSHVSQPSIGVSDACRFR